MPPSPKGLLDTSVLIALESGRQVRADQLPDEVAISPITIAELQAGVLVAADVETRARRLATLEAASTIELLPVDADVAAQWARLRVHLVEAGRRINVNDLWIAATAAAHGLPIVTQDADFEPLEGTAGIALIRV
ncbi:type II toxin-antitoxin system VapC family toxin [Agrococcus lahaulensis]|uniref:type II toxin-antitoxin system VapC family toxin n=1 Tax=Agrococcus lahaulensis TaxID=341722 RepID=UPI000479F2F1|nr:type II toxin-antitoxin system VapC family toxin [Agrococcus lahaulensis]